MKNLWWAFVAFLFLSNSTFAASLYVPAYKGKINLLANTDVKEGDLQIKTIWSCVHPSGHAGGQKSCGDKYKGSSLTPVEASGAFETTEVDMSGPSAWFKRVEFQVSYQLFYKEKLVTKITWFRDSWSKFFTRRINDKLARMHLSNLTLVKLPAFEVAEEDVTICHTSFGCKSKEEVVPSILSVDYTLDKISIFHRPDGQDPLSSTNFDFKAERNGVNHKMSLTDLLRYSKESSPFWLVYKYTEKSELEIKASTSIKFKNSKSKLKLKTQYYSLNSDKEIVSDILKIDLDKSFRFLDAKRVFVVE